MTVSPTANGSKPPPDQPCKRCGKRHQSWRTIVVCRWPRVYWVSGRGPWASASFCRGALTVQLYATQDTAVKAKADIDAYGCGGGCCRLHSVVDLSVGYARQGGRS